MSGGLEPAAIVPQLFPAWRQVEKDLLAQGLKPGQIITRESLEVAFGIKPAKTIEEDRRNALVFLGQFTALRDSLLVNHCVNLHTLPGVGFEVTPPQDQTALALRERGAAIKRELGKLGQQVTYVRLSELSDAQRKENTDAIAKVGALGALVRKQLRGPVA